MTFEVEQKKILLFTIDIFIGSGIGFRNIQKTHSPILIFFVFVILNSYTRTLEHWAHYSGFTSSFVMSYGVRGMQLFLVLEWTKGEEILCGNVERRNGHRESERV